ncbi:MAG: hypothetical protein MUO43_12545, partial [Desulfobacterales bacterium]|nr:hypothetical protein [Desulfobacterales bacterium]
YVEKNNQPYANFIATSTVPTLTMVLKQGDTFKIVPFAYSGYAFEQMCDGDGTGQCLNYIPEFNIRAEDLGKTDKIVVYFKTSTTPTIPPTATATPTVTAVVTSTQPPTTPQVSLFVVMSVSNYGRGDIVTVPKGTWVEVHPMLQTNTPGITGLLTVTVRKDYAFSIFHPYDEDLITMSKMVTMKQADMETYIDAFQANEVSGVNDFRSYFYRVYWNGVAIDDNPTDAVNRPHVNVVN